jgi:hypothetical protein
MYVVKKPGRILMRLTIRAKLVLLVGMALGLLLLSASSGYWGMRWGPAALDEITQTNGEAIHECADSASHLNDLAGDPGGAVDKFQLA